MLKWCFFCRNLYVRMVDSEQMYFKILKNIIWNIKYFKIYIQTHTYTHIFLKKGWYVFIFTCSHKIRNHLKTVLLWRTLPILEMCNPFCFLSLTHTHVHTLARSFSIYICECQDSFVEYCYFSWADNSFLKCLALKTCTYSLIFWFEFYEQ